MAMKLVDWAGIQRLWQKATETFAPIGAVKTVKRNGTALTQDANGAVDVEVPILGVQVNSADLTPDANKKVDVTIPVLGVQVNATDLTPDSTTKKVNVTVAEGATNGTVAVNGSDVAVHGLDAAAYKDVETTLANDAKLPTGAAVKTYVDDTVAAQIATVYKPAGSVAFASLPTLAVGVLGNVYNVTDSFTITSDFVEYASGVTKTYPAGTNVVVVDTDTTGQSPTYKFDVLPGFVDLSPYVLDADITFATNTEIDELVAGGSGSGGSGTGE